METTVLEYHAQQTSKRRAETQRVKDALVRAGYTGIHVGHGTGTACGWLHIKVSELPGQSWQQKYQAVEAMAQQVTGRNGDYGGRINIS